VPPSTQDVDAEVTEVAVAPSTLGDTNAWTNLSTFEIAVASYCCIEGLSTP
jgi:hypothetical protein